MIIKDFFDQNTSTISYVVHDEKTNKCAIIDPVMDYEPASGKVFYESVTKIIKFIQENNLQLEWILETHIHADHLTAASYLKEKLGGKIAIGEGIIGVLEYWTKIFNIGDEVPIDGSLFDNIFKNEEIFKIGNLEAKFLSTRGHTPACGSYHVGDSVFVGDLIMAPNIGTGRTDFPEGSAKEQFKSLQKILSLPADTRIFSGHDYPKGGEGPCLASSVLIQKKENIFAKINNEKEYILAREEKDRALHVPKLLFPAIQINLRCGNFPNREGGVSYLKIPLKE